MYAQITQKKKKYSTGNDVCLPCCQYVENSNNVVGNPILFFLNFILINNCLIGWRNNEGDIVSFIFNFCTYPPPPIPLIDLSALLNLVPFSYHHLQTPCPVRHYSDSSPVQSLVLQCQFICDIFTHNSLYLSIYLSLFIVASSSAALYLDTFYIFN